MLNVSNVAYKDRVTNSHVDPPPPYPVTDALFYRWLAAGSHDKIMSQAVGGHRVYVGVRHP